jgi:hypothetical protein
MFRSSDVPADGPMDLTSSREPGRLGDGSIDYDLYRTLARRLRQDFVAQTTSSLARQAVRASMLLAAWIVPLPDNRKPLPPWQGEARPRLGLRPNHPSSLRKASISSTSLGQAGSPASTT